MRGQATSIQHFHQRSFRSRSTEPFGSCSAGAPNDWRRPYGLPRFGQQQKCLRTSFLPTSNPSTNSGRLSHHMVSLRLGSDVLNQWFKTPGSFQTYLLFTMQTEQAQSRLRCANFYFFKRIFFNQPISPPIQARGRRPRLAGPSGAQRRKPRQRQDKPTQSLRDWWSLSGSNR